MQPVQTTNGKHELRRYPGITIPLDEAGEIDPDCLSKNDLKGSLEGLQRVLNVRSKVLEREVAIKKFNGLILRSQAIIADCEQQLAADEERVAKYNQSGSYDEKKRLKFQLLTEHVKMDLRGRIIMAEADIEKYKGRQELCRLEISVISAGLKPAQPVIRLDT